MLRTTKKVCIDALTGVDNKTFHIAKLSWLLALIVYTIVIGYNLWNHVSMGLTEVGAGFGAISASHSLTILGMLRDDPGEVRNRQGEK